MPRSANCRRSSGPRAPMPPSMMRPFAAAADQVQRIGGRAEHPNGRRRFRTGGLSISMADVPSLVCRAVLRRARQLLRLARTAPPDELRLGRHEHRPAERLLDQRRQDRVVGHHAAGQHQRAVDRVHLQHPLDHRAKRPFDDVLDLLAGADPLQDLRGGEDRAEAAQRRPPWWTARPGRSARPGGRSSR